MNKPVAISFYQFFQQFPNEEAARLYFENERWQNAPYCDHCGSLEVAEVKDARPMPYRCKSCRKHFSVRTGTVLAESRLPLHKWLMAIYMMTTARKGIPLTQMARELGITQKSAWFLAQRIRETWMDDNGDQSLGGHVQDDETYIDGTEGNTHAAKKLHQGRGSVGKIAVVGARDENDVVRAMKVNDVTSETLQGFIRKNVAANSTVVTDSFRSYNGLFEYKHITVNHSVGQYINHMAHTNGIESFWALLKRGYTGIYHQMSAKHLHRYLNEFSFRHNPSRVDTLEFIAMTVRRIAGKRLTYKELIHA